VQLLFASLGKRKGRVYLFVTVKEGRGGSTESTVKGGRGNWRTRDEAGGGRKSRGGEAGFLFPSLKAARTTPLVGKALCTKTIRLWEKEKVQERKPVKKKARKKRPSFEVHLERKTASHRFTRAGGNQSPSGKLRQRGGEKEGRKESEKGRQYFWGKSINS